MAKSGRIVVTALVALVLIVAGALAVLEQGTPSRSSWAESIRIGYAIEAPYAFLRAGGEVTGESPEVAKVIAGRLGVRRIDWVQTNFDTLIPGLEARRFDLIAAGLFITPERGRRVAFSEPTFHARHALLVRRGNPQRLSSYEAAVAEPQVRIAVLSGAIEGEVLRRLGMPESRLVVVPDVLTGRVAVAKGLADGLALSSPTIRWMTRDEGEDATEMARPFAQPPPSFSAKIGYGGFAFRREDGGLRDAWNAAMADFIGSAEHRRLIAVFGFSEDELPGAISTADLLSQ